MNINESIERLRDGELSAEETARLNQRLRDDPAALRELAGAYLLDVAVRDEFALASAKSTAQGAPARLRDIRRAITLSVTGLARAVPQWLAGLTPPSRAPGHGPIFGLPQLVGAMALTFVVASAGTAWLTLEGMHGVGPLAWLATGSDSPAADRVAPLARVPATRNCRWGGGLAGLGFGAEVAGGEIMQLEAGLAELSFPSGGRLVLEGPASFRISGRESVELFTGRVTASVPEFGFGSDVGSGSVHVRPLSDDQLVATF